jgi:two-component system chemotaxis sensor kinase CheA
MQQDDALLNEFLQESRDHLASIETDLLAMEEAGANSDDELVNKVFRAAHSIKGGAGFFSLETIQKLAHRLENALDMVRGREMVPTPEVVNILLLGFDRLRDMINNPAASEAVEIEDLVVALTGLATSHLPPAEKQDLATSVVLPAAPGRKRLVSLSEFDLKHVGKRGKNIFILEFDLLHDVHRTGKTPWSVFKELMACGTILDCAWDLDTVGDLDDEPTNAIPFEVLYATVMDNLMIAELVDIPRERAVPVPVPAPAPAPSKSAPKAAVPAAPAPPPAPAPVPGKAPASAAPAPEAAQGENSLRVSLTVLEQLMNLAGEMVLGRNQLMEAISRQDARAIQAGAQRINFVTSELQEAIMLTRMQPIGNVLNRFPRVVRDLSRELGKEIQLQIAGKDVEIDRTILEGLSDPLTHMVRNAVDHGIELPEARQRAGKPPVGVVDIRVFHEAGQVIVEIQDDGKGLDTGRIAAKALEKGLMTQEQLRDMSAKEQMGLIFLAGLSTADQVSNLSGRGVGMDVVRTNIEKLGGTIDIQSEVGQGSTFRIKLPLTLAIVPSLLVSVGEERFAIPQVNVAELIRVSPDQLQHRIEVVGNTEVLVLRGQLVPLVRLSEALGLEGSFLDPRTGERQGDRRKRLSDRRSRKSDARGAALPATGDGMERTDEDRRYHEGSDLNVVVVNVGVLQYGIVVETLHDTVEIVVKPLGRHLKGMRAYAGATILGDGGVALIVDVVSLAGHLGMTGQSGTARAADLSAEHHLERFKDRHAFLLFHNAPGESCVVPLEQVARVEQIERTQIETIGGRRTMQYRGASLPLVTLEDAASVGRLQEDQTLIVIVFSMSGREVGLLGALPVDSVEVDVPVDQQTHRQPGIAGSMIVEDKTILILDMHEIVAGVIPDTLPSPSFHASSPEVGRTILLAEDSDFFRNQVKRFLESDGYNVIAAEDGEIAWQRLLEHEATITAVVSDIEMPRLNGFELVARIRSEARFASLPVIAVTSLAGEDDIVRGTSAGFSEYQIKLDKERLLESLRRLMAQIPVSTLSND